MKKKIAILGSTSSIGKSLLNIIKKDKKNFKIELLTANTNYKDLISQAKKFNVKNIVITNPESFKKTKNFCRDKNINIFQNFESLKKILPKKVDYVMSAISGIGGLLPTYKIINCTKLIAIANKEAIICGWSLIEDKLKKHKTKFIPVDSEHFSIFSLLDNKNKNDIDKIYITASGGPFRNLPKNQFKNIKLKDALKHPNWRMGKKITIDSATLMNKVFEVIEAKKIFNLSMNKFKILIHPKSYVHAIVKFKNGLIKLVAHDTNMKIPIFNSIYDEDKNKFNSKKININILNNLNFSNVDIKKYPLINILKLIPQKESLFETLLVSINDELVDLFLKNKINFDDISIKLNQLINNKSSLKYRQKKVNNLTQIEKLNEFVRLKTRSLSVISKN